MNEYNLCGGQSVNIHQLCRYICSLTLHLEESSLLKYLHVGKRDVYKNICLIKC